MKRALIMACAALLLGAAQTPPASPEVTFLSGNWVELRKDGDTSCGSPGMHGEQVAFEFARSGGRMLRFEPADLYTGIGGIEVHSEGDVIAITALTPKGERKPLWRIRRHGNDAFDVLGSRGAAQSQWRRCPAAPDVIGPEVSAANLLALTPARTGSGGFVEVLPGETPADICEGRAKPDDFQHRRGWILFELIGPTHFITFGLLKDLEDFSIVRAVHQTAPGTLVLSVYNWPHKSARDLTIHIEADRIGIAELGVTLARCTAEQEARLRDSVES